MIATLRERSGTDGRAVAGHGGPTLSRPGAGLGLHPRRRRWTTTQVPDGSPRRTSTASPAGRAPSSSTVPVEPVEHAHHPSPTSPGWSGPAAWSSGWNGVRSTTTLTRPSPTGSGAARRAPRYRRTEMTRSRRGRQPRASARRRRPKPGDVVDSSVPASASRHGRHRAAARQSSRRTPGRAARDRRRATGRRRPARRRPTTSASTASSSRSSRTSAAAGSSPGSTLPPGSSTRRRAKPDAYAVPPAADRWLSTRGRDDHAARRPSRGSVRSRLRLCQTASAADDLEHARVAGPVDPRGTPTTFIAATSASTATSVKPPQPDDDVARRALSDVLARSRIDRQLPDVVAQVARAK